MIKQKKSPAPASRATVAQSPVDLDCPKLPYDEAGRSLGRSACHSQANLEGMRIALAIIKLLERGIRAYAEEISKEADALALDERKTKPSDKSRKCKSKSK